MTNTRCDRPDSRGDHAHRHVDHQKVRFCSMSQWSNISNLFQSAIQQYLDGVLTLSIQLENVAMMASARRRGWRHVFENNLALADCVFGDVGDEPMNAANQRNTYAPLYNNSTRVLWQTDGQL